MTFLLWSEKRVSILWKWKLNRERSAFVIHVALRARHETIRHVMLCRESGIRAWESAQLSGDVDNSAIVSTQLWQTDSKRDELMTSRRNSSPPLFCSWHDTLTRRDSGAVGFLRISLLSYTTSGLRRTTHAGTALDALWTRAECKLPALPPDETISSLNGDRTYSPNLAQDVLCGAGSKNISLQRQRRSVGGTRTSGAPV